MVRQSTPSLTEASIFLGSVSLGNVKVFENEGDHLESSLVFLISSLPSTILTVRSFLVKPGTANSNV